MYIYITPNRHGILACIVHHMRALVTWPMLAPDIFDESLTKACAQLRLRQLNAMLTAS